MKKVSEIMDELGFRPEGSDAVKKAFIKNLIKQANESKPRVFSEGCVDSESAKANRGEPEQMSLFSQKKSG